MGDYLARQLNRTQLQATVAGDTVRARAIADSGLAIARWAALKPMDRPYMAMLLYLASVRDVKRGAYRHLGELSEERGDVRVDVAWYARFTALWAMSDTPALQAQAQVTDVRERIDKFRKRTHVDLIAASRG